MQRHTAQTVGDKLLTEFICRFGVPLTIQNDQGREFESRLFQHLCEALGADKTRTTPYHPQSDGMVERQNRTIQQMLSAYVNERRDDVCVCGGGGGGEGCVCVFVVRFLLFFFLNSLCRFVW